MTRTFKANMNAIQRQKDRLIVKALKSYPKPELAVMADSMEKLCAAYRTASNDRGMASIIIAQARVKEALESMV